MANKKGCLRIILTVPPINIFSQICPIGLGYIASFLRQNNYNVMIEDYINKQYNLNRAVKDIISKKPDIIGFTVYSFAYLVVKEMIEKIKKSLPYIKIIVGGPHVSALPKSSLEDLNADFAVVGEGEFVTLEIVRRLESNYTYFDDIKGLAFWKERIPFLNPGCNLIDSLDDLPFPSRELMPPIKYNDFAGAIYCKNFPVATVLTSRGCPHRCTFCVSYLIHGRKFRKRSAKNIVDEIELLVKHYKVREININDDTFTEERLHAVNVCKELIERNLKIPWRPSVGLRLDTIDEDLLDIFKASGCYQIAFGIESFSDRTLTEIKKPILKAQINNKIKMIKKYKIETFGYFILGLPEDTEESVMETIKFARDSDLDYLSFTHAIPLPGTKIFEKKYNNINSNLINWKDFYFFTNRPFNISDISPEKLKRIYLIAYFYSYFKLKRFKKLLLDLINFKKVRILKMIKFVYYIIKNLF